MNAGNRSTLRRLWACWLCVGLLITPALALQVREGALRGDGVVVEKPAKPTPTPKAEVTPEAQVTPTVKPWLAPTPTPTPALVPVTPLTPTPAPTPTSTSTPTPTPLPTPTAAPTPTPAPEPSPTDEPPEPSAEDTALSGREVSSLMQNAELMDDETPADYLELPDAMEKDEDSLFLLLIGVDSRDLEKGGRSDAVMLARLNLKTGSVKLVSFLRDMYVRIPGKGMNRLNASYFYGGPELLKETLETNFGVRVDATVAVDFSAMARIIDELGGISLTVTEKERAALNTLLRDFGGKPLERAGEQVLTGTQALCYSRIRKIDNDFQRVNRQHRVLAAMAARVKDLDMLTLLGLVSDNLDSVKTSLTMEEVTALLPFALSFESVSLESMAVPVDNAFYDDVVKGMMVLVPNLTKNNAAIAAFLED